MQQKHRQAGQAGLGVLSWVAAMTIQELPILAFWGLIFLGGALLIYALYGITFSPIEVDSAERLFPNFPIRDLFFHIDSDVCYADDPNNPDPWINVGNDILRRLSTGQLKAWGELGSRPATPIDQAFWGAADFTYFFFEEGARTRQLVHAVNNEYKGDTSYRDVQFNKFEALKIWPLRNDWDASLVLSFLIPITVLTALAVAMAYPIWRPILFRPIPPALGIDDALIRPYPRDPLLLEVGFQFKNVTDKPIHFRIQDFVISVGDDKRLSLARKAMNTTSMPQSMGTVLWFSPFSEGPNKGRKNFITFDVAIEYGPKKNVFERALTARFACDLILGKTMSTDCMIEKEADEEIP